ncbi:YchJ family protein [Alteromonas sp. C1M14]|nr:YchJ family protein [Alteromonas sp. C1M14]MBU2976725.1 YchJ family protein [Alteromonas sp. C1M14]
MKCYCNSGRPFETCCQPILQGTKKAATPENLMRSRFSAYALSNYDYILATYASAPRATLSQNDLRVSAEHTKWLTLNIIALPTPHQVEFNAWYSENGKLGQLHETSSFILEDDAWRYHSGDLHSDTGYVKKGRNEPCICLSGKKFKQCCMLKLTS